MDFRGGKVVAGGNVREAHESVHQGKLAGMIERKDDPSGNACNSLAPSGTGPGVRSGASWRARLAGLRDPVRLMFRSHSAV